MARWSESRGYTLVLTHPRGPDRYARVALVNKRTLFGPAFNVREARAEDASRSGQEPEALGFGRMLSWRWLGQSEAEDLLSARLRTLETLGYQVLGDEAQPVDTRGPWDWLRDLVNRQLDRGESGEQRPPGADGGEGEESVAAQLRETLDRLGLEPDAVMEGLATILEIDEAELREPRLSTCAALEPELLTLLLPLWLGHESESLRAIGQRWIALPTTLYEIERETLEGWAAGRGRLTEALVDPLEREGLALFGPEGLARLAHGAEHPAIKAVAKAWHSRLHAA